MDPNDNNNISESVQLELITVKAELKQELIENADITDQEIDITQNINVTIDNSSDSTVSGQKRKHFEDNSLNVQEDERMSITSNASKSIVKRRRYSDFQNEDSLTNSDTALPEPVPQEREDRRHFTLLVTNLSNEWSSQEVIDYIKEQVGFLYDIHGIFLFCYLVVVLCILLLVFLLYGKHTKEICMVKTKNIEQ